MIRKSFFTTTSLRHLALVVLFSSLVALPCLAGVSVIQNVAPGATSWPGSPVIQTVANPSSQASVGESFNAAGGCTNYTQTFTVTGTSYTLQSISIYAGGGTGTGVGTNITLRLFDLGTQTAPNPSPYSPGSDLFNSGNGLSITYTPQTTGVLRFDFTGSDQVTLQAGRMYAFEVGGVLNTSPLTWQRTTNNTYTGGAAYRNRSWINSSNAREFALAVYGIANPVACTVNWTNTLQRIDGFGGGVVFLTDVADPVDPAFMNTLYCATNANQLGFSLLRVRIAPDGNWGNALIDAKVAVARGAGVLATPWTPPASMKDNGSTISGSLLPAQYTNYANYLNNFAAYMKTNGAPLRAISVQNEPDFNASYEGCLWSAAQFQTFFRNVGGLITNAPVMMPESASYNQSLSEATLNDPIAVTNVDIVGEHLYDNGDAGATIVDYPNAHNKGKPTWMTEFLVNDQTWGTAIVTARQIHNCLTVGNMSAYIWWKCLGDENGLANATGVPQKRGFVMAQFSRFVRPGYYRVGVNNSGSALISAYRYPNSGNLAIVAINNTSSSISQVFNLTNLPAPTVVTPWVTSSSLSLAVQSDVALTGSSFTYTLPAMSVVTFAVQTNLTPTDIVLSKSSVRENQALNTVVGSIVTLDPDAANTFSYSLVSGAGSADNGSFNILVSPISGLLLRTSAAFNYESQSSYSIRVRSTDQGGLFFEKVFTINVTDANETPTDIGLSNLAVPENQPGNTVVGGLSTTDPDSGNTFTYSLVSGTGSADNASFNISGSSLQTSAMFDFETKNSYSVRVRSTDQGGLSVEKVFAVTVEDVNEPPALASVSDGIIGAGTTLVITNTATDPDVPAQLLTFALLDGPTNATLDTASGVFTWRPLISQADGTKTVQVQVTDSGDPGLSATNTFIITVNPVSPPTLSSIALGGGQANFTATGMIGPDYTLLTSTNLVNWETLFTTNPSTMPFTLSDTNTGEAIRFYRLQLGP